MRSFALQMRRNSRATNGSRSREDRKRSWKAFLKTHWATLYACDFFAVEALGLTGTVRCLVFFVMDVKTRAVEISGIVSNRHGDWLKQIARNLVDGEDGFLRGASQLILDRDPVFTRGFAEILGGAGVKVVKIPAQSPNCNPHAERFVRSIRQECLDQL